MKKLVLACAISLVASQAFATAAFLANLHGKALLPGHLFTTTTTSSSVSPFAGLVVYASSGEAYIDLGSEEAKEALKLAVQKSVDGEALSSEDESLIAIYAESTGMSSEAVVSAVAKEL